MKKNTYIYTHNTHTQIHTVCIYNLHSKAETLVPGALSLVTPKKEIPPICIKDPWTKIAGAGEVGGRGLNVGGERWVVRGRVIGGKWGQL